MVGDAGDTAVPISPGSCLHGAVIREEQAEGSGLGWGKHNQSGYGRDGGVVLAQIRKHDPAQACQ